MEKKILGVDIGGTKCAVTLGVEKEDGSIVFAQKEKFDTLSKDQALEGIFEAIRKILKTNHLSSKDVYAIGISCGGPLDSKTGVILSPPNLPGWDEVHIVEMLQDEFGIRAGLQNDANACALAEWKYGAGKGSRNMVFLTFGTGMGAGLILDGKLYAGTNDNAGEVGHIRLEEDGPVGYGKAGSFEGFCSGGGIRQLAQTAIRKHGGSVPWCNNIDRVTAKDVALAAAAGDPLALDIMADSSRHLGQTLSFLIDILNPEVIVIGSIYLRNERLMKPIVEEIIAREALPLAAACCRIVPAGLGESIGDYAALSVGSTL